MRKVGFLSDAFTCDCDLHRSLHIFVLFCDAGDVPVERTLFYKKEKTMKRRTFVGVLASFACSVVARVPSTHPKVSIERLNGFAKVRGGQEAVRDFAVRYMDSLYPAWRSNRFAVSRFAEFDFSKGWQGFATGTRECRTAFETVAGLRG